MRALLARVRDIWRGIRASSYRRSLVRRSREQQAFDQRQELHRAGIFEPPKGGL
jgi:hypothetical protein